MSYYVLVYVLTLAFFECDFRALRDRRLEKQAGTRSFHLHLGHHGLEWRLGTLNKAF